MSVNLSDLPKTLNDQFNEMVYTETLSNSKSFYINDYAVFILIQMKRENVDNSLDTRVACRMGKMCKDSADIIINEANDKVIEVVSNHFKTKSPGIFGPARTQFDAVVINGANLQLS